MLDLRTPRGVLVLIGATYAAAVVLAVGATSQRAWFEGFIREKYAPTPEWIVRTGRALTKADDLEGIRGMSDTDRGYLYEGWVQSGGEWPAPAAAAMLAAAPDYFLERARQTLVCGSPEQQVRAIEFLEHGGQAVAVPLLERAERRARARRAEGQAARIFQALERCRQGRASEGIQRTQPTTGGTPRPAH